MKYEEILDKIGSFGRYQKLLCLYLVISSIPNGYLVLSIVFVGISPPHRCFIPEIDGASGNTTASSPIHADKEQLSQYIPLEGDGMLSMCKVYDGENNSTIRNFSSDTMINTIECPSGWVYENAEGRTTFVTEWDIVCSRSWLKPTITFMFMIGVMTGVILSGAISDRYGRRPVFLVGTYSMFIFFGVCGLASSPTMYMVFMFFSGATNMVNYTTAFVLASEMITTKSRVVVGTLTIGGFALGYMIIPLVVYFIHDWRMIYIATGISGLLFLPYYWLIPESPRWLHCQGKKDEFLTLVKKIATTNGLQQNDLDSLLEELTSKEDPCSVEDNLPSRSQFAGFFKNKTAIFRAFNISFTWFTSAVIYYGISFNTSNLGGNPYINCFVAAAVEIPAYALVIIVRRKIGRKALVISTVLVSGASCSIVPFLREVSVTSSIAVAMVGKFAISATFDVVYIYSAELFPTSVRNSAISGASMFARIGGAVSPYILFLDKIHKALPYVVMMLLGILSAVLTFLLPETRNKPIPDTFQDFDEKLTTWRRKSYKSEMF